VFLNSSLTADSTVPSGSAYLARNNGTTVAGGYCSATSPFVGTGTLSGNSYFYCDNVAYINTTVGSHIAAAGWSGTPNQSATATAGWREWNSTPAAAGRASTASTVISLSAFDSRTKVFAQWNSSAGWTPSP